MICEKNKKVIQLYIDNELERGKDAELFDHLSTCIDCRTYFKSLTLISSNAERADFPGELDERILYSIRQKELGKAGNLFRSRILPVFSYAFVLILIAVSTVLFMRNNDYKKQVDAVSNQVLMQNHTIELLYNSLPATIINGKTENPVIIKAKM